MSDARERAELLAALHAAGAASAEEEVELRGLIEAHPGLEGMVIEFRDSIVALASSVEPIEASAKSLKAIQGRIDRERGGWLGRLRRWLS